MRRAHPFSTSRWEPAQGTQRRDGRASRQEAGNNMGEDQASDERPVY